MVMVPLMALPSSLPWNFESGRRLLLGLRWFFLGLVGEGRRGDLGQQQHEQFLHGDLALMDPAATIWLLAAGAVTSAHRAATMAGW